MKKRTYIEKSFRIGTVILGLILISLLSIVFKTVKNIALGELFIGLPLLTAGVLGIIGFTYVLKGRNENSSLKKIFALIINSGVIILFVGLVVANVMDMIKAIN